MMSSLPNAQLRRLRETLEASPPVRRILELASELKMPNWYLGGGCVTQTVWNSLHGFEPSHGILDFDLGYYDASNLSYEAEDEYIGRSRIIFSGLPVQIRNQARVHLWYESRFGRQIDPYLSIQDAIRSWPTVATCVGVACVAGSFSVIAPYGLDDVFNMTVRPNKIQVGQETYEKKVARWSAVWPKLRVVTWEENG